MDSTGKRASIGLGLAAIMALAGLLGGPDSAFDRSIVVAGFDLRQQSEWIERLGILLTFLGSAVVLVPLAILGAVVVWRKRGAGSAAILLLMSLGGRLLVETLKLAIDRPRPSLEAYPVPVTSLSFPSGHAGNSMMTYVALALFLAPEGRRGHWLKAAILLAIAIGLTRPLLGVHWPTDIIGGWALGLLWTGLLWSWTIRVQKGA